MLEAGRALQLAVDIFARLSSYILERSMHCHGHGRLQLAAAVAIAPVDYSCVLEDSRNVSVDLVRASSHIYVPTRSVRTQPCICRQSVVGNFPIELVYLGTARERNGPKVRMETCDWLKVCGIAVTYHIRLPAPTDQRYDVVLCEASCKSTVRLPHRDQKLRPSLDM